MNNRFFTHVEDDFLTATGRRLPHSTAYIQITEGVRLSKIVTKNGKVRGANRINLTACLAGVHSRKYYELSAEDAYALVGGKPAELDVPDTCEDAW